MLSIGDRLLNRKYELVQLIDDSGAGQTWRARDDEYGSWLIRTWTFQGKRPDPVQQALWNAELRNVFRISGLPGIERSIQTIRDAGLWQFDAEDGGCFVLVLKTTGFGTLEQLFREGHQNEWLTSLDSVDSRLELWRSMRRVAEGLAKIHECQMLHRAVSPRAIFVGDTGEPETFRLGGFAWTIRLTDSETLALPVQSSDGLCQPCSFESDWFGFGVTLARLFSKAEGNPADPGYVRSLARRVRESRLGGMEEQFILELIAPNPKSTLSRAKTILLRMDELITKLDRPAPAGGDRLVLACQLGEDLTRAILDILRSKDPQSQVMADDFQSQLDFIKNDLSDSKIIRKPGGRSFTLKGKQLGYWITEHTDDEGKLPPWKIAFTGKVDDVRFSTGEGDQCELKGVSIFPYDLKTFYRNRREITQNATSWTRYFPSDEGSGAELRLREFQEFFRITNQIELLMRDAEIFHVDVLTHSVIDDVEQAVIREEPRELPDYLQRHDMLSMLSQNVAAEGRVYLGPEEALYLNREVKGSEFWEIKKFDIAGNKLHLARLFNKNHTPPPQRAFLRTRGMFGQVTLLRRRKRAIDRLLLHSYLLRTFLDPDYQYIDTSSVLPRDVNEGVEPGKLLDEAKTEAIKYIWRTRPLFTLQGPPGTGKTTLVASLLRQIFSDSDVTQVLVTAQAHPAVDVLRQRVDEALHSEDFLRSPLAIRFPRSHDAVKGKADPAFPAEVTRRVLSHARSAIQQVKCDGKIGEVRERWRERIEQTLVGLQSGDANENDSCANDFMELVKRSANLTYSSSTSGDLAQIAVSPLTFDWSIIEEAGKAHGFDLVLPLQNAYRWLLIGDHQQLPPYRVKDFIDAIGDMDSVMDRLWELDRSGGLVDMDLVRSWRNLGKSDASDGVEAKKAKTDRWEGQMKVFKDTFLRCKQWAESHDKPPMHSMLWQQHRMHPVLAGLVSRAFYEQERKIDSMTVDSNGVPVDRVVHEFVSPGEIVGMPLIWLDVGWAAEQAEESHRGMYTSQLEVDAVVQFLSQLRLGAQSDEQLSLAVLSPYRAQVNLLSEALESFYQSPPEWLKPLPKGQFPAGTVDSFQGNEADVVVVSLVRNNRRKMPGAFGFLSEDERMNVLFSRAEKLLVLVGAWEFFQTNLRDVRVDDEVLQSLAAWRRATDYIQDCFSNGSCIKIDYSSATEFLP